MKHAIPAALAVAFLASCDTVVPITRGQDTSLLEFNRTAPEGAAPGTCWDKHVTPAQVETVVDDILITPAKISASGTVQAPPVYRSETRQRIVQERRESFTQKICPADLTPEFIASVQRALTARGHFAGPITAEMDVETRAAIRRYQAQNGEDTDVLSIASAQRLGLWAITPTNG